MQLNFKKFEKDMEGFSFGQHQDFIVYLSRLEAKDWTIQDAKNWVAERKKQLREQQRKWEKDYKRYTDKLIECPECQTLMQLLPVNLDPATVTEDDSKSVWLCPNKACMNTIYNKKSIKEL